MHTDSSARRTCMASLSAVEWTATVWMPISRQARWMRNAISPRLAIRTLSNIVEVLFDDHQRLAVPHRRAVLDGAPPPRPGLGCFEGFEGLHGFDDEERLARRHLVADRHEVGLAGFRGKVGRTDDGRGHGAGMLG